MEIKIFKPKVKDIPYDLTGIFKDLKQVNINGIGYDDKIVGNNMHTIRKDISKKYNPYINKIPKTIKEKYEHVKF